PASSKHTDRRFRRLVMKRLWDEEMPGGSPELRLTTLEGLGGAERIVRTHLDRAMDALSPERRALAAEVFHHLVTPSGTKIAHGLSDLADYTACQEGDLLPVLEELSGQDVRV